MKSAAAMNMKNRSENRPMSSVEIFLVSATRAILSPQDSTQPKHSRRMSLTGSGSASNFWTSLP